MAKLSALELRIIRSLLTKEFGRSSPVLDQAASLEFDARHMTGTGYYVTFANSRQLPAVDQLNKELSGDFRTSLNAPADLVGFTLFIRDGYLSSFEGYTFGDVRWPDEEMEEWVVPGSHAPCHFDFVPHALQPAAETSGREGDDQRWRRELRGIFESHAA